MFYIFLVFLSFIFFSYFVLQFMTLSFNLAFKYMCPHNFEQYDKILHISTSLFPLHSSVTFVLSILSSYFQYILSLCLWKKFNLGSIVCQSTNLSDSYFFFFLLLPFYLIFSQVFFEHLSLSFLFLASIELISNGRLQISVALAFNDFHYIYLF